MNTIEQLYGKSLGLLTDLYQLTMAYGYWKSNQHQQEAVFHLFYRKNPFGSAYAIAAGLEDAIAFMKQFRFTEDDLAYLETLTGRDGKPLFEKEFLQALSKIQFSCNVDAIPEGTVVFPHEPLLRIQGPLWQCQLLETALLTIINFQTLIATKSARICLAAEGDMVIEFGLRRAQGIDGGITASRAAYIGGCHATSNVIAGKMFNIPVKGTHAHSWVMSFPSELESFETYANALPNNCIFLVDTYDTIQGVHNATKIGKQLRERGHEMVGIRLDSGDLTKLSIAAREVLDDAGFPDAAIVASSDLDEYSITESKRQGGKINVWGVGTRLVTAYDQPALGGVYKLGAIRSSGDEWTYKVKLSNEPAKVTNPGVQQVRRYQSSIGFMTDVIYDQELGIDQAETFNPHNLPNCVIPLPPNSTHEDLLVPIFRQGDVVYQQPALHDIRERTLNQIQQLLPEYKDLEKPTEYIVGLEPSLMNRKLALMEAAKKQVV